MNKLTAQMKKIRSLVMSGNDKKEKEPCACVFDKDDEQIVQYISAEAEKRRLQRLAFELQWRLNANFLAGNQHCDVNVHRMTVENYRPLYDYMSNEVFNRIAPIMETRLAHLLSANYKIRVRPKSERCEDKKRAQKVTRLLQEQFDSAEGRTVFERSVGLCEQTGSAFYLAWWDKQRKTTDFTVLSPYEVLPEDLYSEEPEDQKSVIIEQIKKAKDLSALYGVTIEAQRVSGYGVAAVGGAGGLGYEGATAAFAPVEKDGCVILRTYMEKPSASSPAGRLILEAGGRLLYKGALPGGRYPLCMIRSKRVQGQFFGGSVIESLIPMQRSYNGIKNRINDYINRSAIGQLLIEDGSVDADDLCDKGLIPGEPVIYRRGAALPKLLEEPKLTEMAETQCRQLATDMEYVAGVSGLMTDLSLPHTGALSGKALENLKGLDSTRISAYAENIRTGVIRLAELFISLYADNAPFRAQADTQNGEEAPDAYDFFACGRVECAKEQQDLSSESAESLSRLLDEGYPEEEGAWARYLRKSLTRKRMPEGALPASVEEQQVENAEKENEEFEEGKDLSPQPFDDDELHLYVHRLYALGATFRLMLREQPEKAEAMLLHIRAHTARLKRACPGEEPKASGRFEDADDTAKEQKKGETVC